MGKGGIITGVICIVLGLGVVIAALFSTCVFLIHGGILLVLGAILILFNKEEDKVEQIKKRNERDNI